MKCILVEVVKEWDTKVTEERKERVNRRVTNVTDLRLKALLRRIGLRSPDFRLPLQILVFPVAWTHVLYCSGRQQSPRPRALTGSPLKMTTKSHPKRIRCILHALAQPPTGANSEGLHTRSIAKSPIVVLSFISVRITCR